MTSTPEPLLDASAGELIARLSQDVSTLIRDELRLAKVETTTKAKKLGLGFGLFGGAGIIAMFGLGALVAAAILGLATAIHAWLAAVIVGAALFVIAAIAALLGKRDVSAGTPPIPAEAAAGVKTDLDTVRKGARR